MLLRRASVFFRKLRRTSCVATARDDTIITSSPISIISIPVSARSFRFYSTTKKFGTDDFCRIILLAQTALVFGIGSNPIIADDDRSANELMQDNNSKEEPYVSGLRRVEDGSIISNTHTVKWRLFTDNGRSLSLQGKLDDAEKQFILALQEAKEGFGERDPHVASSFNNLAEIYRVKKLFEKAEPLYLDAIQILEESFGPEDVRVGAALHNLGQFYLVQRKLDESKKCYERALKIKGRALGYASTDYADTMYHLGTVMNLLGNDRDSVTLIQDSIRILEEGGLGESMAFIRKMRYLSQILLQSNKPYEVENLQRKILHILEISKGWDAVETIVAAESLALTLQSLGNLVEARELIERCLSSKESILGGDHLQVASSKLYLAKNLILQSNNLSKVNLSEAEAELDKAKCTINDSVSCNPLTLLVFWKLQSFKYIQRAHVHFQLNLSMPFVNVFHSSVSFARRFESINALLSFLWWVVGFYWIVCGGEIILQNAPRLYWLAVVFLAFDLFFAIFCVVLACVIGIALCFCLPCVIAIIYALAGQEGASDADISILHKYRYKKENTGDQKIAKGYGIMIPMGNETSDVMIGERVLLQEDAECCICLTPYEDGVEVHSLPCNHHFHSTCIVKWLRINAICPLCKYNILKGSEQV